MSSGFVSGGTSDTPIERSDEWLSAQKEIEANRQRKLEQSRQADGRSLYETLQANKAAKQDAFEEASRLKNQFRALDADEVEFLDSVLESTRREEARLKKETSEGLALFRRQQEEADKKSLLLLADADSSNGDGGGGAATFAGEGIKGFGSGGGGGGGDGGSPLGGGVDEQQWAAAGRKRKRTKEREGLKGLKPRKTSSSAAAAANEVASATPTPSKVIEDTVEIHQGKSDIKPGPLPRGRQAEERARGASGEKKKDEPAGRKKDLPASSKESQPAKLGGATTAAAAMGLVDYGSDDDSD